MLWKVVFGVGIAQVVEQSVGPDYVADLAASLESCQPAGDFTSDGTGSESSSALAIELAVVREVGLVV